MKKPVTWISKTLDVIRSKIDLGERFNSRLPKLQVSGQTGSELIARIIGLFKNPFPKLTSTVNRIVNRETSFTEGETIPDKQLSAGTTEKSGLFNIPPPFSFFVKPVIIIVSLAVIYAIAGFYILPSVLKSKIPEIIQQETGRKASVEKIEFNPFKLLADIRGFKILEKNGKQFAGFDSLSVEVNFWQSLKELALAIDHISLKKPMLRLVKDKQGKFNFEDMAKAKHKPEEKKKEEGGLFPLILTTLSLEDGKLLWEDNHFAKPVNEEISPINLKLAGFSTELNNKANLDFNLTVKSGGKLEWKAKAGINPVFSEGSIKLDKLQLQRLIALALSEAAPFDIQGHELFNLEYKVVQDKKNLKINVNKARLELKDFQFIDESSVKNQLKTPSFAFETDADVTIGNDKTDVAIKKVKLNSKDLNFSNQQDEPVFVELPEFNHETDVKISQTKDGVIITSEKTMLGLKNLQFNGLKDQMVEAKISEIALEAAYRVVLKDKAAEITVNNGKFDLRNLQVSEHNEQKSLIKIPVFGLAGISVDVNKREVVIDSVASKDGEFEAWLTKNGVINYQTLIQKTPAGDSGRTEENVPKQDMPKHSFHPATQQNPIPVKKKTTGNKTAAFPRGSEKSSANE